MNRKKATRMAIDVALSIMIVFEMLIQFTGDFLHEVVGFAFFATVVLHIALSYSWVKKTAHKASKGTLKARQASLAVVSSLLGICMLVLGVSSIAISGILESAGFIWPFGEYDPWVVIHTISSYALCALVVVHLAMHWVFFASALRVPYDASRRRAIGMGVNTVAALGVAALGATALRATNLQIEQAEQSRQNEGNAVSFENTDTAAGLEGTGTSSSADAASAESVQSVPGVEAPQNQRRSRKNRRDDAATRGNAETHSTNTGGQGSLSDGTGSVGTQDNAAGQSGSTEGSASSEIDAANGAGSGDNAAAQESTGSGYSSSSVCTLCRKRCTFDNLRCDKPYREGLL